MKSFRKKATASSAPWHPDFRDLDGLPDVKVVRTTFFINGLSVLALMVACYFVLFQEFKQQSLRGEIRLLEQKISEHNPRNDQVIRLNRDFLNQQRYINEVADYLENSMELSELLIALGKTLHAEITLASIRLQTPARRDTTSEKQIMINGSIRASPEIATIAITEYLKVFHENPFLARRVATAVSTSLVPTPEGDRMAFGIQLRLRDGEAKKEDGK